MLRFWIRDSLLGGQPVISTDATGSGITFAEWSDTHGIPAYLVEEYVPGAIVVHFVNGDPRESDWAAVRQLEELQRAERQQADDDACLLLIFES